MIIERRVRNGVRMGNGFQVCVFDTSDDRPFMARSLVRIIAEFVYKKDAEMFLEIYRCKNVDDTQG